jgi:uncharacterized protein
MTLHLWLTLVLALLTGALLTRAHLCFMHAAKSASEGRFAPFVAVMVTIASATLVFAITGRFGWHERGPWLWPTALTFFGAALFGLGARVNGACTIGTMGRLASGDLGALATVSGGAAAAFLLPHQMPQSAPPPWIDDYSLFWPAVVLALAVGAVFLLSRRDEKIERVIEVTLLGGLAALLYGLRGETTLMDAAGSLLAGAGAYVAILVVLSALLVGAVGAAVAMGRFRLKRPDARRIPLEFVGGALMTAGALAIPGASDVVAFYGMPSGSPHAIVAWVVIFATVTLTFRVTNSTVWRSLMRSAPA